MKRALARIPLAGSLRKLATGAGRGNDTYLGADGSIVRDASGRTRMVSARTGKRSARMLTGCDAIAGSRISLSVTARRGAVFDQIDAVCGRAVVGRSSSIISPLAASFPITRVPRLAVDRKVASDVET